MGLEHKNSALYFFQVEMHSLRAHTIDFFRHRQHTVASSKGLTFQRLMVKPFDGSRGPQVFSVSDNDTAENAEGADVSSGKMQGYGGL